MTGLFEKSINRKMWAVSGVIATALEGKMQPE